MDVSRETILVESIFGRRFVRNGLKTTCFRLSCHEQVKKALHGSATRDTSAVKIEGTCTIWNSSADPVDPADPAHPAEAVSSTAAQTPPSTRAGGQDDVS